MEYPMITNVTKAERQVIVHEVGHNWLYGILGTNERLYPWMDESINNYYEARSAYSAEVPEHGGIHIGVRAGKGNIGFAEGPFDLMALQYTLAARRNEDQAANLRSEAYTDNNYGTIIYGKASLLFRYLQVSMGDTAFDGMMRSYYEKWKFRHPLPEDFSDHVKSYTGKDMAWFFDMMSSERKQDFALRGVRKKDGGYELRIRSTTPGAPFSVTAFRAGAVAETQWFVSEGSTQRIIFTAQNFTMFRVVAYEHTIDAYRKNNTMRTRGFLRGMEPLSLKPVGNFENPYKSQVFWLPAAGANLYNKFMLGAVLHNGLLPNKKFEYTLTPMYAFGTRDANGYVRMQRHFLTSGLIRKITLGVAGARFAYGNYGNDITYNKVAPFAALSFNKKDERNPFGHSLQLRSVNVFHTVNRFTREAPYQKAPDARVDELSYIIQRDYVLSPGTYRAVVQHIRERVSAVKVFGELKQQIAYDRPHKHLDIRVFAGAFLYKDNVMPGSGEYEFKMSGNLGVFDYTYDHALFGRSEQFSGLFAHQMVQREGNMKIPIALTSSNTWMAAVNLVSTIPGPIPVRLFADAGIIESLVPNKASNAIEKKPVLQYVCGIKVVVAEDIFEINIPLIVSDDFSDYYMRLPANKDVSNFELLRQRITFVLNLNRMNPLELARGLRF
jgi:hypothetical protein